MARADDPSPKRTPMMAQYHRLKAEAGDALLFYRMGDFDRRQEKGRPAGSEKLLRTGARCRIAER